ncbi:hypothetical protein BH24ACI5_BH24ACI5_17110 [soil metagenome]
MTPFAVITSDPAIIEAIKTLYGSDNLKYADNVWFIADDGVTARDVFKKLIAPKEPGKVGPTAVVLSVGGYFGVAGKDLWEWLVAKGNATKHGA